MKSIINRQEARVYLAELFQGSFTDDSDLSEHLAIQFAELNVLLSCDMATQCGMGVSGACTAISNIICHLDDQEKHTLKKQLEQVTPDLLRVIVDSVKPTTQNAAA